ncbi:MAG: hypothetical protein Q8P98_09875 [Candidatus Rokubacteria bacterium]|nr:hypothetical protein [Candidatus Rokubacteria bacterium]
MLTSWHALVAQVGLRPGWYCTGDMGYVDDAGDLFVSGRVEEIPNTASGKILRRLLRDGHYREAST